MIKNLSYFLFKILFYLDKFFLFLTKRSLLIWFKDFIDQEFYKSLKIHDKKIDFFIPNNTTSERINTFFSKEPKTLEWIDNFEKKESLIFWDIGANIGLYSIYNAIKNPSSLTISFEPSSSNLRILTRNISINNLEKNIMVIPNPLSDKKNIFQTMNESHFVEGAAINTFGKNIDFQGKLFNPKMKYSILGTTIDYFIENKILEVPDYIKIDVDGIEHLILKGGKNIFKNEKIKSFNIEVNEKFQEQHDKIIDIMKENGFKFSHKYNDVKNSKINNTEDCYNYVFIR